MNYKILLIISIISVVFLTSTTNYDKRKINNSMLYIHKDVNKVILLNNIHLSPSHFVTKVSFHIICTHKFTNCSFVLTKEEFILLKVLLIRYGYHILIIK